MVFPQVKLSGHFKQKGIGRFWGGLWDSGQETQSGFSQGWEYQDSRQLLCPCLGPQISLLY